jgi:hypothetical protein
MGEAMRLASEHRIPTSFDKASPSLPRLLDEVLNRTIDIWRWAATQADKVPEAEFWVEGFDSDENKITEPNKWFQLEAAARDEAFTMLSTMTSLDIDDRRVKVEEFQLEVLGRALRAAARDAGLSQEQQTALGIELRRHIAIIEGHDPNHPQPVPTKAPTSKTDRRIKELEAPLQTPDAEEQA